MILSKWQYSGKNRFVSKINHLDGGSSNNAGYATCVIEELVFESSCHLAPSLVTVCSHFSAPLMGWHLEAYSEAWSVDTRRLTTSLGLVGNCYRLLSIWLKIMRISFLFGVFSPQSSKIKVGNQKIDQREYFCYVIWQVVAKLLLRVACKCSVLIIIYGHYIFWTMPLTVKKISKHRKNFADILSTAINNAME